jgi:hypothetical protein
MTLAQLVILAEVAGGLSKSSARPQRGGVADALALARLANIRRSE